MADGKTSFVLYSDLIHVVEQLPDEKAGKLFLHILQYVNDKDPKTDDIIINIAFEPIKQQLKRDLKKWEQYIEKQKLNGKKGGRPSLNNKTQKTQAFSEKPKKADNVNVTVNVNDNVTEKRKKNIEEIQKEFYSSLTVFYPEFSKKVLREFYDYWSEPNKAKTKIRWQLQKTWDTHKRLLRWAKNDFSKKSTEKEINKQVAPIRQSKDDWR